MSNYSLKPITETSWILQNEGNRVALITKNENELLVFGKLTKNRFNDINELEKFLNSKIEIEQHDDEEVAEIGNINGFPVKHSGAIAVEDKTLPVYKKNITSNIFYSAGYYGVKFPNGWVGGYCPKLVTLTENEFIGPFQTKLEMQNSIIQKKRQIEI